MKLDRTDRTIATLAILIAGVFATTAAGWGVPLIGDSRRWAAVAILVLAFAAGLVRAPGRERRSYALAGLVLAAFLFAVLALATGSLVTLALLVATLFALMLTSTVRHERAARSSTLPA